MSSILFGSQPFEPREVDADFAAEHRAGLPTIELAPQFYARLQALKG